METLLGNLWERLWPFILQFFNFCLLVWKTIWPYLSKAFELFITIYVFLRNTLLQVFSFLSKKFLATEPVLVDYAQKNQLSTSIILIAFLLIITFWIWMLRHAVQNEPKWKKTWIFLIIFLGPFGALAYYVLRKRYFEKKLWEHNRVMLSFFAPMSKKTLENKND